MGKLPILTFFRNQLRRVAPVHYAPNELAGKTVLVIGGNAGIGFEACKHFARMSPEKLIIGCRSQERGQAAIEGMLKRLLFLLLLSEANSDLCTWIRHRETDRLQSRIDDYRLGKLFVRCDVCGPV